MFECGTKVVVKFIKLLMPGLLRDEGIFDYICLDGVSGHENLMFTAMYFHVQYYQYLGVTTCHVHVQKKYVNSKSTL